jgi:hypothetical protein
VAHEPAVACEPAVAHEPAVTGAVLSRNFPLIAQAHEMQERRSSRFSLIADTTIQQVIRAEMAVFAEAPSG